MARSHRGICSVNSPSLSMRDSTSSEKRPNGCRQTAMATQAIEDLAEELSRRWLPLFVQIEWPARLKLLEEMHQQLQEDLGNLGIYCAVSPVLTRKLIQKLAGGPVSSMAQAHIYANS